MTAKEFAEKNVDKMAFWEFRDHTAIQVRIVGYTMNSGGYAIVEGGSESATFWDKEQLDERDTMLVPLYSIKEKLRYIKPHRLGVVEPPEQSGDCNLTPVVTNPFALEWGGWYKSEHQQDFLSERMSEIASELAGRVEEFKINTLNDKLRSAGIIVDLKEEVKKMFPRIKMVLENNCETYFWNDESNGNIIRLVTFESDEIYTNVQTEDVVNFEVKTTIKHY